MPPLDFCTIDFETANADPVSACSVAITMVAGEELTTRAFLIRPPVMSFDPEFIKIHHITPAMVEDAPAFPDLIEQLRPAFSGVPLWAHYAPFDSGVIKALNRHYRRRLPSRLFCTCQLARDRLIQLPSHKLNVVCQHLGIALRHHDAASDAEACARIVLALGGREAPTPFRPFPRTPRRR